MNRIPVIRFFLLCASFALGGCATAPHSNPQDPLEPLNRATYQFNSVLDKAVLRPVAKGYNAVVPEPGRMMVSNFFSNLDDVVVTVNDLLELKVLRAAQDAGRFVVNSTVGLAGIADVATAVGLEKHNKDFGQTLGYWGVGNGPYLVLPLFGPSSVRDGIGLWADTRTGLLRRVSNVDARNEAWATNLVEKRASLLSTERILEEAAPDRYAFIRDAYLQRRQGQIDEDNPQHKKKKYEDEEEDDARPNGKDSANDSSVKSAEAAPPPVARPAMADNVQAGQAPAGQTSTAANMEAAAPPPPVIYHIWTTQMSAQ
jgi:phospholipid-binding lipoprotein MlaA